MGSRLMRRAWALPRFLSVAMISCYQRLFSPLLPAACRYQPTCSAYFKEALRRKGFMRGTWLGLKRLARCHPFGGHGWDPVED